MYPVGTKKLSLEKGLEFRYFHWLRECRTKSWRGSYDLAAEEPREQMRQGRRRQFIEITLSHMAPFVSLVICEKHWPAVVEILWSTAAKEWDILANLVTAACHLPPPYGFKHPAFLHSLPPLLPCLKMGRDSGGVFKKSSDMHTHPPAAAPFFPPQVGF